MSEDLTFDQKQVAVTGTEAFELADFETPVSVPTQAPMVMWSLEKYRVAHMIAFEGKAKKQISRETGIPLYTINKWHSNPEFKSYIHSIVLENATADKAERLMIYNKILDARIEEAEKTGDYARLSKMDTVEILQAKRKETEKDEQKEESKYVQVLDKILSLAKPAIDITPQKSPSEK